MARALCGVATLNWILYLLGFLHIIIVQSICDCFLPQYRICVVTTIVSHAVSYFHILLTHTAYLFLFGIWQS